VYNTVGICRCKAMGVTAQEQLHENSREKHCHRGSRKHSTCMKGSGAAPGKQTVELQIEDPCSTKGEAT